MCPRLTPEHAVNKLCYNFVGSSLIPEDYSEVTMNIFETGEEFYDWLDVSSSDELHRIAVEHTKCFSETLCVNEDELMETEEINDLFVCEVARSKKVSESTLRYLLAIDSGGDGGRYEQIRWAILESPNLTAPLLKEIDPYGPLMVKSITANPLADSDLIQKIFNEFLSEEELISYLVSKEIFSVKEVGEYQDLIRSKLKR
jgi:hypothetical protein